MERVRNFIRFDKKRLPVIARNPYKWSKVPMGQQTRKRQTVVKWDKVLTSNDKPGLFRLVYNLNNNHDKQISIAIHPDIDAQPLLTLSKVGFQGIKLCLDEWNQIISHKNYIENHLKGVSTQNVNREDGIQISAYTTIQFFYINQTPLVSFGPGNVTPPETKGGTNSVCLSLNSWNDLIKISSCVSYAMQCRQKWIEHVQSLITCVTDEYEIQCKEPSHDVCGLEESNILLDKAFNVVLQQKLSNFDVNKFDVMICLLELRCYYSSLFISDFM